MYFWVLLQTQVREHAPPVARLMGDVKTFSPRTCRVIPQPPVERLPSTPRQKIANARGCKRTSDSRWSVQTHMTVSSEQQRRALKKTYLGNICPAVLLRSSEASDQYPELISRAPKPPTPTVPHDDRAVFHFLGRRPALTWEL